MPPTRSTVAHVNLAALQANYRAIVTHLASDPKRQPPELIAVIKANAYGHGAGPVALALEQAGATMLACADIEEGVALRRAGVRVPIFVFGALSVSDLDGVLDHAPDPDRIQPVCGPSRRIGRRPTRHHHRLPPQRRYRHAPARASGTTTWRAPCPPVLASPHLRPRRRVHPFRQRRRAREGSLFDQQRTRFDAAIEMLRALGGRPPLRHAANSAALLRDSRVWYDAVRPGLLLYGIVPPPLACTIALTPAMSLLTSRDRGGEGAAARGRSGLRFAFHRGRAAGHRRRARRLC